MEGWGLECFVWMALIIVYYIYEREGLVLALAYRAKGGNQSEG